MSIMSDDFMAWWKAEGQWGCTDERIDCAFIASKAWNAAMESRCICLADPEKPDICVFDRGEHWISECGYAEDIVFDRKTKHDCQYYKKAK